MSIDRTPLQVENRTGVAGVTAEQIATATGVVSLVVGHDLDAVTLPAFRTKDLARLEAAIDWQAVYVKANPDLATKAGNLTSAAANGVSVGYDASGSAGSLVAPLARYALDRLSWRRSRSVRMKRTKDTPIVTPQTIINDGADTDWTPLR